MSQPPVPTASGPGDPDKTVLAPTRAGERAPEAERTVARAAQTTGPGSRTGAAVASSNVLPAGTRLGEFDIAEVIGEGGFGIVYRAYDRSLRRVIALKEYMPAALAARQADASVVVKSEQHRETFEIGLKSFINEARLLAQFDHPALVKVFRFWAQNGTAYMVMPLYEGGNLKQALRGMAQPPDEAWLRRLLVPLLDAIELLHRANCLHRDIAPDNILLVDGQPLLLDFGAARRVIGEQTQALTVILKPGFAPIEQYDEIPGMKQGPWTDLYALGAVVHFAIAGKAPPPAVGRLVRDAYRPLAELAAGRYSDAFLQAIDGTLAARPEDRPQSVAQLRHRLSVSATGTQPAPTRRDDPAARPATAVATAVQPPAVPEPKAPIRWPRVVIGGVALGVAVIVGASAWVGMQTRQNEQRTQQVVQAMSKAPDHVERSGAGGGEAAVASGAGAAASPIVAPPSASPEAVAPSAAPLNQAPVAPANGSGRDVPDRPPQRAAAPAALVPPTVATEAAPTAAIPPATRTGTPRPMPPAPAAPSPSAPTSSATPASIPTPAGTVAGGASAAEPLQAALRQARECFAAQRYQCTIDQAQSALKHDPANAAARQLLAQAREAQERALAGDWKMR